MFGSPFMPWGLMSWVLCRLQPKTWSFLGCISTEERSLGATYHCLKYGKSFDYHFIEVVDIDSEHKTSAETKRVTNKSELTKILGHLNNVESMELLQSPTILKKYVQDFINNCNGNVILDVSTFPKRYFFPIVKMLVLTDRIKNLLITYTRPEKYYEKQLAEEPLPWDYIPMYQCTTHPPPKIRNAIIGVGFLPFGLPSLLKEEYAEAEVSLIFPFPPGPPNYQRTWEFVREIEALCPLEDDKNIIRVDALDVPNCYRNIRVLTDDGQNSAIFAPYGPKPHSLAMCLFAVNHDCDVYYTQPKVYHPDYSVGINYVNNLPETYSYCVKLDGRNIYT